MATISIEDDEDARISIVRICGEIQPGELVEFTRSPEFAALQELTILDYREASWTKVPTDAIVKGFDVTKSKIPSEKTIACVYASEADFGIGRMFQGKAKFEGVNNKFGIFRDYEEARNWLLDQ